MLEPTAMVASVSGISVRHEDNCCNPPPHAAKTMDSLLELDAPDGTTNAQSEIRYIIHKSFFNPLPDDKF